MVVGYTTTCASAPITTNVASSNPAHDEVYSIQHYVIKWHAGLIHNKADCHDITEILLKVALNTITITPLFKMFGNWLVF